jgi:hypothetical protein
VCVCYLVLEALCEVGHEGRHLQHLILCVCVCVCVCVVMYMCVDLCVCQSVPHNRTNRMKERRTESRRGGGSSLRGVAVRLRCVACMYTHTPTHIHTHTRARAPYTHTHTLTHIPGAGRRGGCRGRRRRPCGAGDRRPPSWFVGLCVCVFVCWLVGWFVWDDATGQSVGQSVQGLSASISRHGLFLPSPSQIRRTIGRKGATTPKCQHVKKACKACTARSGGRTYRVREGP